MPDTVDSFFKTIAFIDLVDIYIFPRSHQLLNETYKMGSHSLNNKYSMMLLLVVC